MRQFLVIAIALVALVFGGLPAMAGDLVNESSQSYDIEIIQGASTTHSSIGAGTTRMSICSDCTIRVKATGSEGELGSDDTLIITDQGGLRKKR